MRKYLLMLFICLFIASLYWSSGCATDDVKTNENPGNPPGTIPHIWIGHFSPETMATDSFKVFFWCRDFEDTVNYFRIRLKVREYNSNNCLAFDTVQYIHVKPGGITDSIRIKLSNS